MTSERVRSSGRPTLDEVAARAGVGRGTASRVVNGSPQVSPQAREAVRRAIAELGYVPNRAARALVTRRTDSVALVVSESQERVFEEPFFAGIVRGISSVLSETSMQLWLSMAQSSSERERFEHHLDPQHVDGVMLLSLHDADPLPALLASRGLPTVLGGRPARMVRAGNGVATATEAEVDPVSFDAGVAFDEDADAERGTDDPDGISYIDADNVGGARLAVEYLLGRGRSVVGAIAGPQDMGVGVARLAGYRRAVEAAGLPFCAELVAFGDFSEPSGAAAVRQLLAARPDLDAVFAGSDLMAAGAVRALREDGRRVPDDVAVVGFEDSPVARQTEPPLTTVHQSVEAMGREMARLLLARIAGRDSGSVLLDTHLVERASA